MLTRKGCVCVYFVFGLYSFHPFVRPTFYEIVGKATDTSLYEHGRELKWNTVASNDWRSQTYP